MNYQHRILGIIFIISGGIFVLFLSLAVSFMYAIPFDKFDTHVPEFVRIISLAGSFSLMLFLGIPSVVTGIGLLKHKKWAEQLVLPLACFYLLFFPMGTAVGIYSLVVYFGRRKEINQPARAVQE
jgi:hypothetical protein